MIETFSYKVDSPEKPRQYTIYSPDIASSVAKWISILEDLQKEVYSFNAIEVQNIKQQYLSGQIKINLESEPFFLTYKLGNKEQVVNIEKVNKGEPDFIAKVGYLTTEEGGRKGYAASGYRPHVKFDGKKELTSGEQLFVDKDKVFQGEMAIAEIRIIWKEAFKNYLHIGQHFEFAEGSKLIGRGEIIEITNKELLKASR
jgi:hypothetical protein